MSSLKKAVTVLCLSVCSVAILVFMLENQQLSQLTFFGLTTPLLPSSVFMAVFLLVGMLIGPVLALAFRRRRKRSAGM
jgi:uncharacterized integral membrane protein